MARIRTIKPGFFHNEYLAELPFPCRLLFIGLWTQADKEGRLEDRPKRLKAELFPYDNLDIDILLSRLQSAGFIIRYEVGEMKVIQVISFCKHQRISGSEVDTESLLPPPDSDQVYLSKEGSTEEALRKQIGSTEETPRTSGKEGKGKEGKGKEGKGDFTPPSIEEVEIYFEDNGYSTQIATKAFNYYNTADWKDSKGNKVKNWKQKMIAVWFKDENKKENQNGSQQSIFINKQSNKPNPTEFKGNTKFGSL